MGRLPFFITELLSAQQKVFIVVFGAACEGQSLILVVLQVVPRLYFDSYLDFHCQR